MRPYPFALQPKSTWDRRLRRCSARVPSDRARESRSSSRSNPAESRRRRCQASPRRRSALLLDGGRRRGRGWPRCDPDWRRAREGPSSVACARAAAGVHAHTLARRKTAPSFTSTPSVAQGYYRSPRKTIGGRPIAPGAPFRRRLASCRLTQRISRTSGRMTWQERRDSNPQPPVLETHFTTLSLRSNSSYPIESVNIILRQEATPWDTERQIFRYKMGPKWDRIRRSLAGAEPPGRRRCECRSERQSGHCPSRARITKSLAGRLYVAE